MVDIEDFNGPNSVGEVKYPFETQEEREEALQVLRETDGFRIQAVTAANEVVGLVTPIDEVDGDHE